MVNIRVRKSYMQIIDTQDLLKQFISSFHEIDNANDLLAVDTEFIREKSEVPILCLIQMATKNNVFIVDPIAIDISPLNKIFNNNKIRKIFHSARQDLEVLSNYGVTVTNFYDTQLYEMLLNTKYYCSYRWIVYKYIGKQIKKNLTMSDWRRRPLSKKQLQYSVEDVIHLIEIYETQSEQLSILNRLGWLDEEHFNLLPQARSTEEKNLPAHYNDEQIKIYHQLMDWRNTVEERKLIASDYIIKKICMQGKDFTEKLKNSRNIKDNNFKEFLFFAEKIICHLDRNDDIVSSNVVFSLLKVLLQAIAARECVCESMIATSKELEKLSMGIQELPCLCGWRNEIFGIYAMALLRGEISIKINKAKVVLV